MGSNESQDFTRRNFLKGAAVGAAGLAAAGLLGGCSNDSGKTTETPESAETEKNTATTDTSGTTATTGGFSLDGFSAWALEGGNAGAAGAPFFLPGEENKPTESDLDQILQTANTYFQCHYLTGTHFVVVRDTAEQAQILQIMGGTGEGTALVLLLADGVKDQAHHQEQYYPGMSAQNGGNPEYWQMVYAYIEAGMAAANLNLAALELGYRTRCFGALNVPDKDTGEANYDAPAADYSRCQGNGWDIDKYMQPKDGGDKFEHYCMALERKITCDGNLTMLCAIAIGKIDEADAVTSATASLDYKQKIRTNYSYWD